MAQFTELTVFAVLPLSYLRYWDDEVKTSVQKLYTFVTVATPVQKWQSLLTGAGVSVYQNQGAMVKLWRVCVGTGLPGKK